MARSPPDKRQSDSNHTGPQPPLSTTQHTDILPPLQDLSENGAPSSRLAEQQLHSNAVTGSEQLSVLFMHFAFKAYVFAKFKM